ncbi:MULTISPECIES: heme exporter protein CcmD [Hyphobacterium]|uniref:Heme exporter protein D n=1 Tax=Hyphobacterium vulgare TaxID=1736751 RepID=A0ABV6ZWP8_9PROT
MSELFAFSHPAFIWPAYAITALGVGGLVYWILSERAAVKKRLEREERRAAR